jgi:hypothetical protein
MLYISRMELKVSILSTFFRFPGKLTSENTIPSKKIKFKPFYLVANRSVAIFK